MNLPNGMDASIINERLLITKENKTVFSLLPEDVEKLSKMLQSFATDNIIVREENPPVISEEDLQFLNATKEYELSLPEVDRPRFHSYYMNREWKHDEEVVLSDNVPETKGE